jgi:hypothetical protein
LGREKRCLRNLIIYGDLVLNNTNKNEVFELGWLTPIEVQDLTGYKQAQKQKEALNQMGIDHKDRPDGSLVVFKADLASGQNKEVRFVING